ncbi:hypothetical protein [Bacillus cereus]|uniref:hypothetical protein n=1 Tax=Bacillus cereus TaxID=1396 RepID=UPI0018F39AED|nr:hypothetical protein [Bacillus cereus]MBJ8154178.1 hypothetical protein [Bacillus cereus]
MIAFTMPNKQELIENQKKYNLKEMPELRDRFRNMPFFHQIRTFSYDEHRFLKPKQILESNQLISLKLQGPNADAAFGGTSDYDKALGRDEYVYLRLGAVFNVYSVKSFIVEIPSSYLDFADIEKGFFCNDISNYQIDYENYDLKNYKGTILSIRQGIDILADYVGNEYQNDPSQYTIARSHRNIYNAKSFLPEFAVKGSIAINEPGIKIHLVGLPRELIEEAQIIMEKHNYSPPVIHNSNNDFKNYLTNKFNSILRERT